MNKIYKFKLNDNLDEEFIQSLKIDIKKLRINTSKSIDKVNNLKNSKVAIKESKTKKKLGDDSESIEKKEPQEEIEIKVLDKTNKDSKTFSLIKVDETKLINPLKIELKNKNKAKAKEKNDDMKIDRDKELEKNEIILKENKGMEQLNDELSHDTEKKDIQTEHAFIDYTKVVEDKNTYLPIENQRYPVLHSHIESKDISYHGKLTISKFQMLFFICFGKCLRKTDLNANYYLIGKEFLNYDLDIEVILKKLNEFENIKKVLFTDSELTQLMKFQNRYLSKENCRNKLLRLHEYSNTDFLDFQNEDQKESINNEVVTNKLEKEL
jgi:hypothetical protein